MRITRLECEDFRGFKVANVDFDSQLTVLVGGNGAGKSSILDAISVLLSQYSARLIGSPSAAARLKETDVYRGAFQTVLRISASDHRYGSLQWSLLKLGRHERLMRPRSSELTGLNEYIKSIVNDSADGEEYLSGETLLVYYDQSRSILKIPQRRRMKGDNDPEIVFRESIRTWGINFPKLTYWFQDRETDEIRRQKRDPSYVDPQIDAVRRAITTATGLRDPYFSVNNPRGLTLFKGDVELHVSQLSTGEQVFLALAADLARRLACVAHEGNDPLLADAIVLIDEIELHLHPKWQREIIQWLIETFPNCQFIISTHSPQVLGEVHSRHIRILDTDSDGGSVVSAPASFGRDSNYILLSVLGAVDRRPETLQLMNDVDLAITTGHFQRAANLLASLRSQMEGLAPEITVLESRLNRRIRAES